MHLRPTLPWEVIERVIDYSSEHTITLCNIALTCCQLHPRSILVLLTSVKMEHREQVFHLCDLLRAKPQLRHYVRSVTIPLRHFAPYPLLSILPNLRDIRFHDERSYPMTGRFIRTHRSTLMCCQQFGIGVRSLTILRARFSTCMEFVRVLSAFTGLEDLSCARVRLGKSVDIDTTVSSRLLRHLRLKALDVRAIVTTFTITVVLTCLHRFNIDPSTCGCTDFRPPVQASSTHRHESASYS